MATYKIKVRELSANEPQGVDENILVTAKNTDTLEEYSKRDFVNPDYLAKLQYWLDKRKYACEETSPTTLHLSIDNLFDFNLERTARSDAEMIRDELAELKREKQSLILE